MCGRYADPPIKAYSEYKLDLPRGYETSYNVLPGSFQPIITKNSPLQIKLAKWGLIPSWSKEFKATFTTFNARAETIMTSRVYKRPFLTHRCLVLAQAFYEWHTLPDGEKIRYVVKVKDRQYFSFAGFYDTWQDAEEKEFYSYTIITTAPTKEFSKIHTREAVILHKDDEEKWLDEDAGEEQLLDLLQPYPAKLTEVYPAAISSIKRDMDSPELLKPQD